MRSQYASKDAKLVYLKNANKLYVSLKVTLQFQDLSDLANSSILCLTDAAFANFKNGGSQVLMNVNDITFIYFSSHINNRT